MKLKSIFIILLGISILGSTLKVKPSDIYTKAAAIAMAYLGTCQISKSLGLNKDLKGSQAWSAFTGSSKEMTNFEIIISLINSGLYFSILITSYNMFFKKKNPKIISLISSIMGIKSLLYFLDEFDDQDEISNKIASLFYMLLSAGTAHIGYKKLFV